MASLDACSISTVATPGCLVSILTCADACVACVEQRCADMAVGRCDDDFLMQGFIYCDDLCIHGKKEKTALQVV